MGKIGQFDAELKAALEELLEEYLRGENEPSQTALAKVSEARFGPEDEIDSEKEAAHIKLFLETPCSCGRNCQAQFSADEVADARKDFRLLSLAERNSSLLFQLRSFSRASELSQSARTACQRVSVNARDSTIGSTRTALSVGRSSCFSTTRPTSV